MRNKLLIGFAVLGIGLGIWSAYILGIQPKPQPPAFKPASNPYEKGIYANGIVETAQASGENINVYPEVSGTVVKILVTEGQHVKAGTSLLMLEDSVQRSTTASTKAQIDVAKATYKSLQDQFSKQKASWLLDSRSVSKDILDTAENAVKGAKANLELAQKQYQASNALLTKYVIKALSDGTVLSINTAVGSYISSQGVYDTYTGVFKPVIVMGNMQGDLAVRCYIDEILIHRIPDPSVIQARMSLHGTDVNVPLKFVRIQPNVSPKIELSSQRTERVDVRVLPVIFSFEKREGVLIYPGQLVDVYIGEKKSTPKK
ncbi:MAG: biotin/lipoyl-binding protein [Chlorobiales bacterium]|nr:biotin/lipoyl-binding protein [Chlorobiales bacterium]